MTSIDNAINQINHISEDLPEIIGLIAQRPSSNILKTLRWRLHSKGTDALGIKIGGGTYSLEHFMDKQNRGQENSHFTLFYDGGFYSSMVVETRGRDIFIDSKDSKTADLEERYTNEILGLTESETDDFLTLHVEKEIIGMFEKIGDIEI